MGKRRVAGGPASGGVMDDGRVMMVTDASEGRPCSPGGGPLGEGRDVDGAAVMTGLPIAFA